jgi:class 3 adenylate cyclase/predicted ATPase
MKCPRCQHDNPLQSNFCLECGARLALTCASCGAEIPQAAKFCNRCGTPVGRPAAVDARFASPEAYTPKHLAERILTSRSALEGERKQVTVLFADLKGSMELLAERDPEEARKLLDPVLERMMEAVHRYEGTVNQVMGDGIMALFGAPLAHEDHAVRACYAALKMQESVTRYGDEVQRTRGVPVQIRVGLNSGEVVVRSVGSDLKMDYTAVGQTTHLAARMEQMAKPGSILATGETFRLAEGHVQVRPLGQVPVKGLDAAVNVYEVTGAGPFRSRLQAGAARGLTRFVGRADEFETVCRAQARAEAGRGQVVAVVGEPGVGKSRLFWEFTRSHRTRDWLILESSSVSYGKATPYLPVIDLLRAYFQIEGRDDNRKIREKVTGKLLTLDEALKPALPAFLALLDVPAEDPAWRALDPSQRRGRTLDAIKRLLLRESQVQPLLVVFEDLHWIDSETQAFLDGLVESLPTARLLLLVNYRPEYRHGWGSKTYYTQLRLDPLPLESAQELLEALLGSAPALGPLKRLLIERTEGNPLFLEESVRTLVETDVLVGQRGAYLLAKAVPSIQVPATVQAVLAARIDRLPPEEKRLLQSAAVVGEDVPYALLQATVELPEEDLRRLLGHLQAAEFLYEARLFPEVEYTFKHGLTYQVAYGSLLQERRRGLHARIVEAIERLYPDRLVEQVERLAHHALRGEIWTKATTYLRQAGRKAAARSAHAEAAEFFEQALSALAHLPETEETMREAIDIRLELGPVLMTLKGSSAREAEAAYARAQELCAWIGDQSRLFPALWGLWYGKFGRGEHRAARALGEQLLGLAQTCQEPALLLEAHHTLWATLTGTGEPAGAMVHIEQGRVLYDPGQHRSYVSLYGGHDPGMCYRVHLMIANWALGFADQALASSKEALALARELSHPLTTAIALYMAAWLHYHRGEQEAAKEKADACLALSNAQGFRAWQDASSALLARLMVEEGRGEEGIAGLEKWVATAGQAGRWGWRDLWALYLLAETYALTGRSEKGIELLGRAATRPDESFYDPELHRLRGDLLVLGREDRSREVEACFRQALEIARGRQQRAFGLRAATSLGRLLQRQGRREEARRGLAEFCASFTEGFDTRDLRDARSVLEAL